MRLQTIDGRLGLLPAVVGMQLFEKREFVQPDGKGGDESVLAVQDFEACENCRCQAR